ncbi:hypothetical protein [Sanguibacter massiliensis]|uniref:hypothetical protein n=1 Tax=Sanguibacter massiliensis TaxID=1973217 RepID=UPI000C818C9B|nr:hypothetical protein [Sanguibacter massiliensis]
MTLSKTFAAGAPLSAADVNSNLVNHVPSSGDPFIDGPVDLVNAADVRIRIRRAGMVVTVWATGTIAIPPAGRPIVGPSNVIPGWLRPAEDTFGLAELRWLTNGVGSMAVDRFGSVTVWNPTSVTASQWAASVTYVVGS